MARWCDFCGYSHAMRAPELKASRCAEEMKRLGTSIANEQGSLEREVTRESSIQQGGGYLSACIRHLGCLERM